MGVLVRQTPWWYSHGCRFVLGVKTHVQPGVWRVRLLYLQTKRGIGGWAVVKRLKWVWERAIPWGVLQIQPTKYDRFSKDALWCEASYASSSPSRKPFSESFSSRLPKFQCHMWKLEAPKPWNFLELSSQHVTPTTPFFPWSAYQGFHTCDSLLFTRWLKVSMWIKINPKVFVFMGYLNWVLV